MKITGLFHGNIEEEEAGLVGKEGRKRAQTPSSASAVGRPTAAVDAELTELVCRSLITHTGIVYMRWEHVCVCVWEH